MAERMRDCGSVVACDRSARKVSKIDELAQRLHLQAVQVWSCMRRGLGHVKS
jgi:16S rRNA C967 or C1407 C5-methylase (RsmB/RsmF family)